MTGVKIGWGQTACLLAVSRIIVSLTYSPSFFTGGFSSADLLATVLAIPVILLQYIPVFLLSKRGESVISASYRNSSAFGNSVSVLYVLFFIWTASVAVARFDVFISTSVFSQYVFYGFMLPSILTFFAVIKGIEGIARASVTVLIGVLLAVALVFFVAIPKFDFLNIISPLNYGKGQIFRSFVSMVSRSNEAAVLCVLIQYVKEKLTRAYFLYLGISAAAVFTALLTVILVIGDFSFMTMFPYDSAAGNLSVWSFLDLEPLLIFAWIVGVFIKCSLCVALAVACLEKILKNTLVSSGIVSALVMAVSFILARDTSGYKLLFTPYISLLLIAVFGVIIPVIALLGGKKCSKKR